MGTRSKYRDAFGNGRRLIDGARQMILQTARWLPDRRIVAVTDSGFSAIDLLDAVRTRVCMVTRLRLDARLFAPAPKRKAGTLGRPRRTGERLPTLAQRLANPRTRWRPLVLADWYGEIDRRVEIVTGCAVRSHPGRPVVPLQWLLVRDPTEAFKTQAFLCTDLGARPADILSWFVRRWTIEVTFAEACRHLAVETQRQWSDMAIARTTPVLLGLFALVAICDMQQTQTIVVRSAGWYRKKTLTFSDALAAVRCQLWWCGVAAIAGVGTDAIKRAANSRLGIRGPKSRSSRLARRRHSAGNGRASAGMGKGLARLRPR